MYCRLLHPAKSHHYGVYDTQYLCGSLGGQTQYAHLVCHDLFLQQHWLSQHGTVGSCCNSLLQSRRVWVRQGPDWDGVCKTDKLRCLYTAAIRLSYDSRDPWGDPGPCAVQAKCVR